MTIALISVLAAVVIPAVTSQITKGDLGRVSSDLLSIRSAMEQFISDVRRYPSSVAQLTNKPTALSNGPLPPVGTGNPTCALVVATTYTAQEVARWRGPYLNKDSLAAIVTGYSQSIRPCFDAQTPVAGGISYEVILVPGIDSTTAAALDAAMDDGSATTGALRWLKKVGAGVDTLKFLAIPIQP